MKHRKSVLLLLVLIIFIFSGVASANGSTTKYGTVGGVRYIAKVGTSSVTWGGWNGYTEASTASSVDVVGWYWNTRREYCGGVIYFQKTYLGYQDTTYPYTYAHVDTPYFPYNVTCLPGVQHKISSLAKFDFKYAGDSESPILEFIEVLPSGW